MFGSNSNSFVRKGFPLFGSKLSSIKTKHSVKIGPETDYEVIYFLISISKFILNKLSSDKLSHSQDLSQILEDDSENELMTENITYLDSYVNETELKNLVDLALSQSTPKKIINQVIDLVAVMISSKSFLKNSEEIISQFKHTMIETFINGKDDDIRVKTVQIIKLFLIECKGYFRKFCEFLKTTQSGAIRQSILTLLIEYATTVDKSVTLTVFELI